MTHRLAILLALLVAAASLALGTTVSASAADDGSATVTKKLTRTFATASGADVVDERQVTLHVDKTTQLQGRERVRVSWKGAHPSAAAAANPFGESGLNQEYPVVIMQCRGLDDSSLPTDQQLSPSTCWTSTRMQRSQLQPKGSALWARDLYADPSDTALKSGLPDYAGADCKDSSTTLYAHVTPFLAASGKFYPSCTSETMAPEAAVGASFPPAEQEAFTDRSGEGSTSFEVRSSVENESLGCSPTVRCSLVVVPIMGLSCAAPDPAWSAADSACRATGQFAPGTSNYANMGVDDAVSPLYWWAASNWRNRMVVPLTFGLPPSACDILDDRAPKAFYGSELLSQAALQWAPAYCLRKDRFKWQQNSMPDDAAFGLMQTGQGLAAEVSSKRDGADTPTGYAPTAVTGFAVSYVIDQPDNTGEYTHLRLDARLLAKLLTESYPATNLGASHPGLGSNPLSMNRDPEFKKLNPGLDTTNSEAAATLMSLSTSSDVIRQVTQYIAQDADAVAFLQGKADPWGMVVNPSYKNIAVPTSQWPLLDTFVPPSNLECQKQNPAPYLPQVAAPVNNLRRIAEAVLDGWPLVSTKCDRPTPNDPFKLGRVDRQGVGSRFLVGLTTLGDARRFGLPTAALQAAPGSYVEPTDAGLDAAVRLLRPGAALMPFTLSQAAVAKSATAYPGTMVVYTAARLQGMAQADADTVADFISISRTEGQRPGRGNGQLADGYLPIRSIGSTAALYASAGKVATAVRAQKAPPAPRTKQPRGAGGFGSGGTSSAGGSTGPVGSTGSAAAAVPAAAPAVKPGAATAATEPASAPVVRTAPVSSGLGGYLLPLVLAVGVAGGVLSLFGRAAARVRGAR
jgi:hypothetical protein